MSHHPADCDCVICLMRSALGLTSLKEKRVKQTPTTDGENDVLTHVQSPTPEAPTLGKPDADPAPVATPSGVAAVVGVPEGAAPAGDQRSLPLGPAPADTFSLTIVGSTVVDSPDEVSEAVKQAQDAGIFPPRRKLARVHTGYDYSGSHVAGCAVHAAAWARSQGLEVRTWPAEDGKVGAYRMENLKRNEGLAPVTDVLLVMRNAFINEGTGDLIARCLAVGKPVFIYALPARDYTGKRHAH